MTCPPPPETETVDFAAECREAFDRMAREHAAINPNEMGRRNQNAKLRLRKHVAIDAVLDQWLLDRELKTLEAGL